MDSNLSTAYIETPPLRLSPEHVLYLLDRLPTYESPPSEALQFLIASLCLQYPEMASIHLERLKSATSASFPDLPALVPSESTSNTSRGDTQISKLRQLDVHMDYQEESADEEVKKKKKCRKGKGANKNKNNAAKDDQEAIFEWGIGKPPRITPEVTGLISELSHIENDGIQEAFHDFISSLKTSASTASNLFKATTLQETLSHCATMEVSTAVQDVYHMVALIKAAFWIERSVKSSTKLKYL
jgi:hypothetical protein